jgi:hypothetical protein
MFMLIPYPQIYGLYLLVRLMRVSVHLHAEFETNEVEAATTFEEAAKMLKKMR